MRQAFNHGNESEKLEAIAALADIGRDAANSHLLEIVETAESTELQTAAIQALIKLNSHPNMQENEGLMRRRWARIMWRCDTYEQRVMLADALAAFRADWSNHLLEEMKKVRKDPDAAKYATDLLKKLE